MEAHARAKLPRYYFDWSMMAKRPQKSFIGTLPVNMFYGLRELIRLLEEEGLPNVCRAAHAPGGGDAAGGEGRGPATTGRNCSAPIRRGSPIQ